MNKLPLTENHFRIVLELEPEAPFEIGFRQGAMTGAHATARQVMDHFPQFSAQDVSAYLNGREDGVRKDGFRLGRERAGRLWPRNPDWLHGVRFA